MSKGIGLLTVLMWSFTTAGAMEKVSLQLRWDHQFQFAGYYAADWQGFYAENGLTVEIRSALTPTGILSATQEVQQNRADFGIGAADILIAQEQGIDLSVLAVIFQQSASAFYLKAETPFTSLADLMTLRVARLPNDLIDIEFQAMLRCAGLDPAVITTFPHQPGIAHLLSDQVQVMPGYRTSIPFLIERHGLKFREIRPNQYGIDFYGDSLFCQTQLTRTHPDLIVRFVQASLKGWAYALDHPDEIARQIATRFVRRDSFPGSDLVEFNRFQADIIRQLTVYSMIELGHINPYRWEYMHHFLVKAGLVKQPLNLTTFVFDEQKLRDEQNVRRQRLLFWIVTLMVITLAVTAIFLIILRQMVRQQTTALRGEIAERQQVEETLRKNEERLQNVLDILPVGVWIADRHGTITHGNPVGQQIWAGARYIGPAHFEAYKAWWVATGKPVQPDEWGVARAIARGERSSEEELEIECFDGTHKIILNWAVPIWGPDHTIEGAVAVNQDITDRKRAEEALRTSERNISSILLNAKGFFIYRVVVDKTAPNMGQVVLVSPSVTEIAGITDPFNFLAWFEQIHPDDKERVIEANRFSVETGVPYDQETRWYHKLRQEWIWVRTISNPVFDEEGRVTHFNGLCLDITDQKRAEELIKNQNVQLEQAVQQKQREMETLFERMLRQEKLATIGQMAGSIAHELRNPLGAVKQSVFCLKRLAQAQQLTGSDPKVVRHLELIDAELNTSERVIANLLDLTRLNPPQHQPTDVRVLLTDIVERCDLPEQVHASITLEPDPLFIVVDPLQIRQVLLNVLTNAAQAMAGEGTITIHAQQRVGQGETVIEIQDSGVGIPPEALSKVFDPLYTTKATGAGLGLSICKQIIESHQGRICLVSQPEQGTTVTIRLPEVHANV